MAAPLTVLAAVRGAAETDVVLALGAPGAGTTVTRRCGDVVELLAAASAGAGAVAVLSGDLPGLDRETVARLHAAGVRTVALDDAHAADRLRALGIDVVLDGGAARSPDVLVAAVRAAALGGGAAGGGGSAGGFAAGGSGSAGGLAAGGSGSPGGFGGAGGSGAPGGFGGVGGLAAGGSGGVDGLAAGGSGAPGGFGGAGGLAAGGSGSAGGFGGAGASGAPGGFGSEDGFGGADGLGDAGGPAARGRVVAVWGPVGAPGRTTTAVELAAELAGLARRGAGRSRRTGRAAESPAPAGPVLLVDADTCGSSLAMRLGLLDDAPGIAAACRAARQGTLDVATLARHSPLAAPGLRVLTGITRAARWPEIPASGLEVVLETARELAAWTVVDTAAAIEADEVLMYDTHAPQRNAATLAALAAADDVVVVGSADPVGIQRLVRGLEELREAPVAVPAPTVVVVNRVRAAVAGRQPEAAVREAMARYAGLDDVVLVPEDGPALDAALLAGRTLAEHAPGSAARTAVAGVADRLRAAVPLPA